MLIYEMNADDREALYVTARSLSEAADVTLTFELSRDRRPTKVTLRQVQLERLSRDVGVILGSAVALELTGVAHWVEDHGWTYSATEWVSVDLHQGSALRGGQV